jgi:ribose transport system ATP-binding protein
LSINEKEKVLEVKGLTRDKMAHDINFSLFRGEILGFYGLVGSGRTELAHILIGKEKYDRGQIFVNGRQVRIRSIYEALSRYRMGYVTEDRRRDGLIMLESVKTNTTITVWDRLKNKFGLVSGKGEREITWEQIGNLNIKATGIHQKVGKLSGGNQQKVNVAKWLAANTDILIIDEPTVGVDVGAKEYFTKLIWRLAENKKSIILISSDMPEIIKLAHRILVFSENRIVGEVDNSSKDYQATSTQIGDLISEFRVVATAE